MINCLIRYLTNDGFIKPVDGVHLCYCGDRFATNDVLDHFASEGHQRIAESVKPFLDISMTDDSPLCTSHIDKVDCSICYTSRFQFYVCTQCGNEHCMECHERLRYKCPFCRYIFVNDMTPLQKALSMTVMDRLNRFRDPTELRNFDKHLFNFLVLLYSNRVLFHRMVLTITGRREVIRGLIVSVDEFLGLGIAAPFLELIRL